MDGRMLATIFWACCANCAVLVFSLVRIFAVTGVKYGLADLFKPRFYLANPIFIALMIIGPVTFISDLMVFHAAGEISTATLGLLGLSALNLVGVIFGFLQFVLVNVLFKSEQIPSHVWILLVFWFVLVVSGTITGTIIMGEIATQ